MPRISTPRCARGWRGIRAGRRRRASWLNAVENFFSKITRQRIRRGAFHSLVDLQVASKRPRWRPPHNVHSPPSLFIAPPLRSSFAGWRAPSGAGGVSVAGRGGSPLCFGGRSISFSTSKLCGRSDFGVRAMIILLPKERSSDRRRSILANGSYVGVSRAPSREWRVPAACRIGSTAPAFIRGIEGTP